MPRHRRRTSNSRHFCRLNGKLDVKVSDFGLSRVINAGADYYRAGTNKQLPVKWMAPESLTIGIFTTFSDVVRQYCSSVIELLFFVSIVVLWRDCMGSDDSWRDSILRHTQ